MTAMELEDTVQILCSPGIGHEKSSVSVEWREEYSMKVHPSLSSYIDIEWENRLKDCKNLFNASKFRLHGVEIRNGGSANTPEVKLLLGTTSYKDFIGTNASPYAEQLVKDGLSHFSNPQAYLSDALGVGALLVSKNDDLIFMRRSDKCAEMQGMLDRPGGHPEPGEVPSAACNDFASVDPTITEEIFASVLKEIRDEINIPLENLSSPILLGIGYNPKTWKRPSLEFYVSCSLGTKEIFEMYAKQTQVESEESTELLAIPVKEVSSTDLQSLTFFNELTHASQAALYFLKIFQSQS